MTPHAIRRSVLAVGMAILAGTIPLFGAEKEAPSSTAVQQSENQGENPVQQTPPSTHDEFVTWLRKTDLGKLLRRDPDTYTIEKKGNATIMRLNGGFHEVLVMKITPGKESLPVCIGSEEEAEAILIGTPEEKKR